GLDLAAGNSTVEGLVINHGVVQNSIFGSNLILMQNGSDNHIAGNFLGTDVSGTVAPNPINTSALPGSGIYTAIWAKDGSRGNLIGPAGNNPALDAADRNIVSGTNFGIELGSDSGGNVVAGNFIGTDRTGEKSLANWVGIGALGSDHDRIGPNGTEN